LTEIKLLINQIKIKDFKQPTDKAQSPVEAYIKRLKGV